MIQKPSVTAGTLESVVLPEVMMSGMSGVEDE